MVLIGNTLLRRVGFAIFVMLLEFEGDLDGEKSKPGNMIGTKGVGKVQERKWWKISGTRKCHLAERGCCTSKSALAIGMAAIGGNDLDHQMLGEGAARRSLHWHGIHL